MKLNKREFLQVAAAGAALLGDQAAAAARTGKRNYRRIAVEEAFATREVVAELSRLAGGVPSMKSGPIAGPFMADLLDIGERRIRGMDTDGIDVQVLSLTSPGVQKFDAPVALALARDANDQMAAAISKYPGRFGGLATIAPQAPGETVKELQRCIQTLGLNGGIINSHTNGEYLDDAKYWPILEAFEALDVPLYIHPRDPSPGLEGPLNIFGFAVGWGFAVETGTHALRLIAAGVFDRFPKLRIVLGHMGETLPFLLDRIDNRYLWQYNLFGRPRRLKRLPSEYFRENFVVTSSGMNYHAPLMAAIEALGEDKVLFAVDYPMENQSQVVAEATAIPLSPALGRKFYETNSMRVFRLK
jgi:2,3-dihydroxybenzoate decarboxylase